MENNNDNISKAMTLMGQAMKYYDEGKIELGEYNRKEANKLFDQAASELSTEDGLEKHMYGENRNFGLIYSVIEENATKMYKDENGKKNLAKVVKFIQSNPVLLNEFKVYNAFRNPVNVENVDGYIESAVKVMPRYSKKELQENNSKLIKFAKKLKMNEAIDICDEDMDLFEAIEYAMLHKESISNINEYMNVKKTLSESVSRNNKAVKNTNVDTVMNNKLSEITEKYDRELTDDEKAFIQRIAESKDLKALYEQYKSEVLPLIKEKMDKSSEDTKAGWAQVYEEIQKGEFDENKGMAQIAKLADAKNNLTE